MIFRKHQPKVFCIGCNKTGTTTIARTLKELNFKLGDQVKGELLFFDWHKGDYKNIIKLCKTADAFQDIPFSLPFTYVELDRYFKNAKFILTVRDDASQWYESLVKFHSKLWSNGSDTPTSDDLKNADYRYKGYAYETFKLLYNTEDRELYNKEVLTNTYNTHNASVRKYFQNDPDKLIVLNVSQKNDYFRLCEFLNKKPVGDGFPWENKT